MIYARFFLLAFCILICPLTQAQDTLPLIQTETLLITGQYLPTDVRSALHAAKIITAADIQNKGAVTVADALSQISNIRIQNDPILGSSITLNGLSGRNIKFLLNGVPIVGRQNGNIDLSQLNVFQIQRIEVIEGPMAVMYGSDAIAGVVNIITKQYATQKWGAEVQVRGETRAARVASAGVSFHPHPHHHLRMGGNWNQFTGWAAGDSSRDWRWNPKTQGNALINWTFDNQKKWKTQVMVEGMREFVLNNGEVRRPQFKPYAFDEKYFTQRLHAQFSVDYRLSDAHFFTLTGGTDQYYRKKENFRTDLTTSDAVLQPEESDTSTFFMQMIRGAHVWNFRPRWVLQSGINFQWDWGTGKRLIDSTGGKTQNMAEYAAFSTLKWTPITHLSIEAGARAALHTRVNIPIIPSLHMRYWLPKQGITMRASYARGFRTPDFKELYFQFVDFNHNIVGNPNLSPESAHAYQLSIDKKITRKKSTIEGEARFFWNNIQNKIELYEYKIGEGGIKIPVTDTTTLLYSYFNVEKYRTFGGNFTLKYRLDWLTLGGGVSPIAYLNPSYEQLKVSPYTLGTSAQAEVSFHLSKTRTHLYTYHQWNDKQVTFYADKVNGETVTVQRITSGFWNTDVVLTQGLWRDKIQLAVGGRNLWDVQQVQVKGEAGGQGHISDANISIGPGRSMWVQLMAKF